LHADANSDSEVDMKKPRMGGHGASPNVDAPVGSRYNWGHVSADGGRTD